MSPYPISVQEGFGIGLLISKGTCFFCNKKGTNFGEYRTQNNFGGPKKNKKEYSFGNTGKGLIITIIIVCDHQDIQYRRINNSLKN